MVGTRPEVKTVVACDISIIAKSHSLATEAAVLRSKTQLVGADGWRSTEWTGNATIPQRTRIQWNPGVCFSGQLS